MRSSPRAWPASGSADGWSLLRWACLLYGGLAAAAIGWNEWAGRPWAFVDERAAAAGVWWTRDVALGLATATAVVAVSQWITVRTLWGARLARELAAVLGPLSWAQAGSLAALSGFAEEVFFRGAVQPRIGWLAASVVFGLAHFAPRRSLWPWTGFAVVAGGLLGALYAATGNVVAPIVAHAAINAVNLRLLGSRCDR